jgi:hypothetical protein
MRLVPVVVAAFFLGFGGSAIAQSYDTPEAMLSALYSPYLSHEIPENSEIFRSKALNALYAADSEASGGEVGAIEFDPVINGQDWTLTDFAIGKIKVHGDTAIARVTFKNFETANTLDFTLINEDGWKYDNIVASGGDYEYSLVDIFEEYEY